MTTDGTGIRLASRHVGMVLFCSMLLAAPSAHSQVKSAGCPAEAIAIEPGAMIQELVDGAKPGAAFCFKNGIHRAQAIRPRTGQRFYGEGRAVLNGSKLITDFWPEDRYWVATNPFRRGQRHGECLPDHPTCNEPHALFLDDKPLVRATDKRTLPPGSFYIDYQATKIYMSDDPRSHKVEAAIAVFAFESAASDVLIRNLTVEKFASPAQRGAIHTREGTRWIIENCVIRLNSGHGINVGSGTRVHGCDIHDNGQLGIGGDGNDIVIADNRIWSNNTRGFDPDWEAGGVKLAETKGAVMRGNHVYDNDGPGLWCDIECRDILYEENLVQDNRHTGIFHEISFNALIRNNLVRNNGGASRRWFWGADIAVAASQDVEVTGNKVTVAAGGCGIMLIDQGRTSDRGRKYKTRDNQVHGNVMTFQGGACGGGASDTKPGDENFDIIAAGNNRFDRNSYRIPVGNERARFAWGHDVLDWHGFRKAGQEQEGELVRY